MKHYLVKKLIPTETPTILTALTVVRYGPDHAWSPAHGWASGKVSVSQTVEESTVARMIALVTQAQAAKAPSERFSDWFGQRYTVAVMAGAILASQSLGSAMSSKRSIGGWMDRIMQ